MVQTLPYGRGSAVIAIDLGGTKLATAVVDEKGIIHAVRKVPVEKTNSSATIAQMISEANSVLDESGVSWDKVHRAGVIVPGIFRKKGGVAWAPNLWGNSEIPLLAQLRNQLPVPVCIDSDRAGYVLGEHWLGAAQGLDDVVFVAVGTGIGAGILSGGKLVRGAGDVAGAVGWMALNPQFEPIYSQIGCWEAEAAGPSVARQAGQSSAESVFAAARKGDSGATKILEQVAGYLAMGIANLISVLNPQMVVLGGGLMQAGDLLLPPIRRAVPRWAQPYASAQARIELTTLADQAGLFGAARLAFDETSEVACSSG